MLEVDEQEIQRVKNSFESHYTMERTTLLNKARILAMSDALGDLEMANNSLDRYLRVSKEEIIQATRDYYSPTNCSTLYYLPEHGNN